MTGIVIGMDHRDLFNDNGAGFAFFLINFLYGFGGLLTAYAFSFLGTDTHFPPKKLYSTGKKLKKNIILLGRSAPGAYTYYLMFTIIFYCMLPFGVYFLRLLVRKKRCYIVFLIAIN